MRGLSLRGRGEACRKVEKRDALKIINKQSGAKYYKPIHAKISSTRCFRCIDFISFLRAARIFELIVFLFMMIQVVNAHERFVEVAYGRYRGLKGPGIIAKLPGSEWKLVRLRVGDRGELVSPELGRFHDADLPGFCGGIIRFMGSIHQYCGPRGSTKI